MAVPHLSDSFCQEENAAPRPTLFGRSATWSAAIRNRRWFVSSELSRNETEGSFTLMSIRHGMGCGARSALRIFCDEWIWRNACGFSAQLKCWNAFPACKVP